MSSEFCSNKKHLQTTRMKSKRFSFWGDICHLVLPQLAILLLLKQISLTTAQDGVIVSGIYVEEVDDSPLLPYESLAPIVLEFKLNSELNPTISSTVEPRIVPKFACRNENRVTSTTPGWGYTCPVFFHINNLLTQFKTNFSDNFFNLNTYVRGRFSAVENVQFTNRQLPFESCETLLRTLNWNGINIKRDTGLLDYRIVIEKCAAASFFEESIQDFTANVTLSNAIYEKMRDNFINTFGNDTSNEGNNVSMLIALQSLMTLNSFTEINRWKEAMSSCQNNFIPNSLVKIPRMERALTVITDQLSTKRFNKMELAVTLSQLYQLPVTDCIFGTKSLFVRILVPLKRSGRLYKPLKVNQPQFLYDTELCHVTSKEWGARLSKLNFLYESNSKEVIETPCDSKTGGFCKVNQSPYTPQGSTDKCLSTVITASSVPTANRSKILFDEIRKNCKIECELINTTSKVSFPMVQQIGPNKFLIITNIITPLLIKCEAYGAADQVVHPQKYGGIEITIPCNCYLMLHTEKHVPSKPCTTLYNSALVHHVIPIMFVNTTFVVPYMSTGFLTARLNSYYTNRFTLLNLNNYINMTFRDEDIVEVDVGLSPNLSGDDSQEDSDNMSNNTQDTRNDTLNLSMSLKPDENSREIEKINCCGQSLSVWVFVLLPFQFILMIIFTVFVIIKLNKMEAKVERGHGAISFSVSNSTSQMTLADKFSS